MMTASLAGDYDLIALDTVIGSYDYDTDPLLQTYFRPIEHALWMLIERYGEGVNDIGWQIADHLRRTSLDGMKFLTEALGFSARAGKNFHAANLFQDLGKIHGSFAPTLWDLPHRPTDEERRMKITHTEKGVELLNIALREAPESLKSHPHVAIVIPAIQLFHHERVDGSGPFHKKGADIGQVIKSICIIDAKDGDMIQRGHQPERRNEKETLIRMKTGEKYQGAFDDMLDTYIHYRERISI
ncbi:MAG: hypothetical protein J0L77_09155 [Alphaproteobacteria bacterium]|nr:hypothetical protein [Alphaproteobacteria bacterium]